LSWVVGIEVGCLVRDWPCLQKWKCNFFLAFTTVQLYPRHVLLNTL
jgi:hypothetical protein